MNKKNHEETCQMMADLLCVVTETEVERLTVLQTLMCVAILTNTNSKEQAEEIIKLLAESLLKHCEFWSKHENCHWRQDGETVQ